MKIQFKIIYAHRKEHLNIGELYKRNPLIKTIFSMKLQNEIQKVISSKN